MDVNEAIEGALDPIGRLLGSRGVWPLRRGWGTASVIWSIFCWNLATMDITTTTSDPIKRYTEFTPFYRNTSAIINEFSYIQNINSVYLDTHKEQHKCWAGLTWNTTTGFLTHTWEHGGAFPSLWMSWPHWAPVRGWGRGEDWDTGLHVLWSSPNDDTRPFWKPPWSQRMPKLSVHLYPKWPHVMIISSQASKPT